MTRYEVDYTSSDTVAADAAASGTDAAAGWVATSRTLTDTTASQTATCCGSPMRFASPAWC